MIRMLTSSHPLLEASPTEWQIVLEQFKNDPKLCFIIGGLILLILGVLGSVNFKEFKLELTKVRSILTALLGFVFIIIGLVIPPDVFKPDLTPTAHRHTKRPYINEKVTIDLHENAEDALARDEDNLISNLYGSYPAGKVSLSNGILIYESAVPISETIKYSLKYRGGDSATASVTYTVSARPKKEEIFESNIIRYLWKTYRRR